MRDYLTPVVDSTTTKVVFPKGRKPLCLPRKHAFGKLFAPASEKIKVIPRELWSEYAAKIKTRHFTPMILDQDGVGSCATEQAAMMVMRARAKAGLPFVALNPWFIYHTTSGGWDRGSSIDENLRFVQEHGIAPMEVWSRDEGWQKEPSAEAKEAALEFRDIEVFDIASIDEMVSALLLGFDVAYGSKGHAVVKIEHIDESKGLDVNSWGEDWGDGGYGVWASYRAVNWAYGAYAVRAARGAA